MPPPPYSPNLAFCDFQVFSSMKRKRALRSDDMSPIKIGCGNSYRMLNGNFSTITWKNSCHATINVLINLVIM